MSQIVGKVQKGGGGVNAKIKIVYILNVDYFDWGEGVWIFRFFPKSSKWYMALNSIIYVTDIGEMYATFGTYMA